MLNKVSSISLLSVIILFSNAPSHAANVACSFDSTKSCSLARDLLNDKSSSGSLYYGATNYDHRMSGEIELYNSSLVTSYQDNVNAPGQIKFLLNNNKGVYTSGEIMTRAGLHSPPFNSPNQVTPWNTKGITSGYIEVIVKMPKCDTSDDGLCQSNTNPLTYNSGLWPAIWMLPTNDSNWPLNSEIDLAEAYSQYTAPTFNISTATLHFNGNDASCMNNDCVNSGYSLGVKTLAQPLFSAFHTWGMKWQTDPSSADQGYILTGYLDNVVAWGPIKTDALPADGKNALSRGFNDPNGGFYLIVNLAAGGPYAGAPNPHMQTASMYVQSIKVYNVIDTPPPACAAPINVQSMYSTDKKQITISWQSPSSSAAISYYQMNDWSNHLLWKGVTINDRAFLDATLPGTSGTFTYNLYSVCGSSMSTGVKYNVVIP
jgi:beta-glucanase (GH16 family)